MKAKDLAHGLNIYHGRESWKCDRYRYRYRYRYR